MIRKQNQMAALTVVQLVDKTDALECESEEWDRLKDLLEDPLGFLFLDLWIFRDCVESHAERTSNAKYINKIITLEQVSILKSEILLKIKMSVSKVNWWRFALVYGNLKAGTITLMQLNMLT